MIDRRPSSAPSLGFSGRATRSKLRLAAGLGTTAILPHPPAARPPAVPRRSGCRTEALTQRTQPVRSPRRPLLGDPTHSEELAIVCDAIRSVPENVFLKYRVLRLTDACDEPLRSMEAQEAHHTPAGFTKHKSYSRTRARFEESISHVSSGAPSPLAANPFVKQQQLWLQRRGFSARGVPGCLIGPRSTCAAALVVQVGPARRALLVGRVTRCPNKRPVRSSGARMISTPRLTTVCTGLLRREQRCRDVALGRTAADLYRRPTAGAEETNRPAFAGVNTELVAAMEDILQRTLTDSADDSDGGEEAAGDEGARVVALLERTLGMSTTQGSCARQLPPELQELLSSRVATAAAPLRPPPGIAKAGVDIAEESFPIDGEFVLYSQCHYTPAHVVVYDAPHGRGLSPLEVTMRFHLPIDRICADVACHAIDRSWVALVAEIPERARLTVPLTSLMRSLERGVCSIDVEDAHGTIHFRHSVSFS